MERTLPQRTRTYQNHLLDSTRWDWYAPRDSDVVVATPYKSGTTWMLSIVRELFALTEELPPFREMWIDCRFRQASDVFARELEAQEHRRYLKSHLALDGIPYFPEVKYIVVGRDVRDVFMSFWNHYRALAATGRIAHVNGLAGRIGPPLPDPPDDIHAAWQNWIGRGWFAWEHEGYPFWGNMHHVQSWWDHRHLGNVLLIHFNDLKRDLSGEIRRVGHYLDITVPEAAMPAIRDAVSVDSMRKTMAAGNAEFATAFFRHRGENGRWRDVLSDAELELYDHKAAQVLTPECRAWLEDRT